MNELRSTSTGLASSTLPLTLILVRCDQLVRAPHSHATTVHGDCKITVQYSHGFFFPLNRVIAKTRKVRSRITRDACTNRQVTVWFTGNSRTVSPPYGTCFMSAFRHLEFEGDFLHSWKMCAPLQHVAFVFPTISISDSNNNNNNNNNLLQLGCYPVAVVILHVYKI